MAESTNGEPTPTPSNGKSCKGFLYYSLSSSKGESKSRGPFCVGVTGSVTGPVPEGDVPKRMARDLEEASKDAKTLLALKYACLGYAVYSDRNDQASAGQQTQAEVPFCRGLNLRGDFKISKDDPASAPADIQSEDENGLPHNGSPKPTRDEFSTRFTKSANLVANGIAKNIRRVGNQIKESLDDIIHRKPK